MGKSIGSSRSIHLLLGNWSAHALEAYRDSGEARGANHLQQVPRPFTHFTIEHCLACNNESNRSPQLPCTAALAHAAPSQSAHTNHHSSCSRLAKTRQNTPSRLPASPSPHTTHLDTHHTVCRRRRATTAPHTEHMLRLERDARSPSSLQHCTPSIHHGPCTQKEDSLHLSPPLSPLPKTRSNLDE